MAALYYSVLYFSLLYFKKFAINPPSNNDSANTINIQLSISKISEYHIKSTLKEKPIYYIRALSIISHHLKNDDLDISFVPPSADLLTPFDYPVIKTGS